METDVDIWRIRRIYICISILKISQINSIDLDNHRRWRGKQIRTLAIEGDWHDIPSIRGMIKHDVKLMKHIVRKPSR